MRAITSNPRMLRASRFCEPRSRKNRHTRHDASGEPARKGRGHSGVTIIPRLDPMAGMVRRTRASGTREHSEARRLNRASGSHAAMRAVRSGVSRGIHPCACVALSFLRGMLGLSFLRKQLAYLRKRCILRVFKNRVTSVLTNHDMHSILSQSRTVPERDAVRVGVFHVGTRLRFVTLCGFTLPKLNAARPIVTRR